jgi:hypothetical protein
MPPTDHDPTPSPEPTDTPGSAEAVPASRHRLWLVGLVTGLLAGAGSWLAGEAARRYIDPTPLSREVFPGAQTAQLLASASVASGMLTLGLQGAILGMSLGLAGGLAGRSAVAALKAAAVGAVVAGSAGALAARFLVPLYFKNMDDQAADLTLPLLIHGGMWCPIGATAGLAFGLGLGGVARQARAGFAGLLGAGVGTMVYEAGGALIFPLAKTVLPISLSAGSRALAHLSVATLTALCAAVACQEPTRKPVPAGKGD